VAKRMAQCLFFPHDSQALALSGPVNCVRGTLIAAKTHYIHKGKKKKLWNTEIITKLNYLRTFGKKNNTPWIQSWQYYTRAFYNGSIH
jgi:hypothetical protein